MSKLLFKASVEYGIRAVVYLAERGEVCSSREISDEMGIPRDYLIQLALHLRKAGLLKAHPGKNGGYELAKDPSEISLGQIINIFDSDLKHGSRPLKKRRKSGDAFEAVRQVHSAVLESFNAYLAAISVQCLIDTMKDERSPKLLIADELEAEAARLRAKA